MAMPISLGAGADATRRAARRGAQAGCADATRRLISSLHTAQRRVLADALAAGVDVAALLRECEQPTAAIQKQASNRSKPTVATHVSGVRAGSVVDKRLEYCFEVNKRLSWFGGKVLRDAGRFWVDVLFDDGEEVCVKLLPSAEGTVWRWPRSPRQQSKRGQRDEQTVDTAIGPVKLCDQVWIKWVDGDGEFYAANVVDVSSVYGITVCYPESADWAVYTETLPISDITPERVTFDPVSRGANHKRCREAAAADSVLRATAAVVTGEGEEPDSKRRQNGKAQSSRFVGVSWCKRDLRWNSYIHHCNKRQHLGNFGDEIEAARAYDAAARLLHGDDAHDLRGLNFPSESEVKMANEARALRLAETAKAMAVSKKSKFVGVSWTKKKAKWSASLTHVDPSGRNTIYLGSFIDEHDAARAYDRCARRLRGRMAHGGRKGSNWSRLNAPTDKEVAEAKALGMPSHLNVQLLQP